jgi:hypothetical protein
VTAEIHFPLAILGANRADSLASRLALESGVKRVRASLHVSLHPSLHVNPHVKALGRKVALSGWRGVELGIEYLNDFFSPSLSSLLPQLLATMKSSLAFHPKSLH